MFLVSSPAKKKLKKLKILKFWILSPIVMLITYKANNSSKPIIRSCVVSERKLGNHYIEKIVEIDGLRIIPNINVILNSPNANKWLLDVTSDGYFVLFADGKIVEPYWPNFIEIK